MPYKLRGEVKGYRSQTTFVVQKETMTTYCCSSFYLSCGGILMRMNTICVLTYLSVIPTATESQELGMLSVPIFVHIPNEVRKVSRKCVFAFISTIMSYVTESRYLKCSYWTHLSHLTGLSSLPCTALASDSTATVHHQSCHTSLTMSLILGKYLKCLVFKQTFSPTSYISFSVVVGHLISSSNQPFCSPCYRCLLNKN